jgi:hypothetical protein
MIKLKKYQLKKQPTNPKLTRVNLLNLLPRSWDMITS